VADLNGFPNPIAFNVLANNWAIEEEGYSNEEWKVIKETHKILGDDSIHVAVTTVRVPAYVGHGESVWIQTEKAHPARGPPARCSRRPPASAWSMKNRPWTGWPAPCRFWPRAATNPLVGRIRRDLFDDHALAFWVVGDNLRKGAALNAVQIAEVFGPAGLGETRGRRPLTRCGSSSSGRRASSVPISFGPTPATR
jgi:aspartate-semialdehyde dehydrogenase